MSLANSLKEAARENVVTLSVGAIPSALVALLAWAWPDTLQNIAVTVLSIATPKQILAALCISLVVNAVLITLLKASRTTGPKLRPRFGVYWDKQGNAYCPRCKTLTAQIGWASYNNGQWHGLRCPCTERPFVLIESGQAIHAQEAMRQMQDA